MVLLSKCFSEADGTTFAHVNFTATPQQSTSHPAKRLFFAELMLIPDLQAYEGTELSLCVCSMYAPSMTLASVSSSIRTSMFVTSFGSTFV